MLLGSSSWNGRAYSVPAAALTATYVASLLELNEGIAPSMCLQSNVYNDALKNHLHCSISDTANL